MLRERVDETMLDYQTSPPASEVQYAEPILYGGAGAGALTVVIGNAALLPPKEGTLPAVRFDLTVRAESKTLVRVGGWRVCNGAVLPPARRVGRGFIPTAEVDNGFHAWLERAVRLWRDAFPTVMFPLEPGEEDRRGMVEVA